MDERSESMFGGLWDDPSLVAALERVPTSGPATIKVNHDNVLAAAKIIQTQVDALADTLRERRWELKIQPPGNDRVSVEVARAWNDRLLDADDSYANRVRDYVESLRKITGQLLESAKQYGFSEEDIAASFGERRAV